MGLQVIALVLVLAITFMHSIFGFFSGLINVFCSIISLAVALGFYEPLNRWATTALGVHPAYCEPVCIFLLFFVTLILLRSLADAKVRGNVSVPQAMDWGGAALCGLVNAQIAVGIIVICTLMLPLGGKVLGFERYERLPEEPDLNHKELAGFERVSLWTRPDEFAVGLFKLLSRGSLKGGTAVDAVYPDYMDFVFYSTNTVQPESTPAPIRDKKGGDGFDKGLELQTWWIHKAPIEALYRKTVPNEKERTPRLDPIVFKPATGHQLIAARLTLKRAAADRPKSGVGVHLFRPTMLRLVGDVDGAPAQYFPRVLSNADTFSQGRTRVVDLDNNFAILADVDPQIDAYFEVPEGFKPRFVEYRRHARVPLAGDPAKNPPTAQLVWGGQAASESAGGSSSGSRTFGSVLETGSDRNTNLPFAMLLDQVKRLSDVKLEGKQLVHGRITGPRSRLAPQGGAQVETVDQIKEPPGKKLLQIRYQPKKARSLVGEVFNFAGQVNQYFARSSSGDRFPLAGYSAVVKRNNQEYVEFFFNGDAKGEPLDPGYKSMLDFKELKRNELNDSDDALITLYFVVDANSLIVKIENQTGDGGDVNLQMGP